MQTLERTEELGSAEQHPGRERRRRRFALVTAIVLIAAVAAGIAYALGSANSTTRTVVKTVQAPAPSVAPPATIDDRGFSKLDNGHQAETKTFDQPLDPATRLLLQHQLELARERLERLAHQEGAERGREVRRHHAEQRVVHAELGDRAQVRHQQHDRRHEQRRER